MADDDARATQRFYELAFPHLATVLRLARVLTSNDAEAEDLAQETMLKAFRSIDRFQDGTDAKAWLTAILRNARIDRLRKSAGSAGDVSLEDIELDPASPTTPTVPVDEGSWDQPEDILEAFSDEQVVAALQRLPEEIRWTILLVDVEGWDQADAAGALGVPVGTIKSRLHRGRAMLRGELLSVAKELRLVRE